MEHQFWCHLSSENEETNVFYCETQRDSSGDEIVVWKWVDSICSGVLYDQNFVLVWEPNLNGCLLRKVGLKLIVMVPSMPLLGYLLVVQVYNHSGLSGKMVSWLCENWG